jgi:hypothetical protein
MLLLMSDDRKLEEFGVEVALSGIMFVQHTMKIRDLIQTLLRRNLLNNCFIQCFEPNVSFPFSLRCLCLSRTPYILLLLNASSWRDPISQVTARVRLEMMETTSSYGRRGQRGAFSVLVLNKDSEGAILFYLHSVSTCLYRTSNFWIYALVYANYAKRYFSLLCQVTSVTVNHRCSCYYVDMLPVIRMLLLVSFLVACLS